MGRRRRENGLRHGHRCRRQVEVATSRGATPEAEPSLLGGSPPATQTAITEAERVAGELDVAVAIQVDVSEEQSVVAWWRLQSSRSTTYTFDVFSSIDGFGSVSGGDWGGYWGKQGPELLDHRLALYSGEQRMVFGANTYRQFAEMLASSTEESEVRDPWVTRMVSLPAIVVSTTLRGPLDWPDGTVVSGDAVDVVARLKEESEVPLRSHGSLSLNRALMAAGLVDRVQVTFFPVITGHNGSDAIFQGAADFDLELIDSRTLDGNIQELTYRPTLHM